MSESKIRAFAKEWYLVGRSILPSFDSSEFPFFAGRSASLAYAVSPMEESISIRIDKSIPTAAADLHNRKILIGTSVFSREFFEKRFGETAKDRTEELAISLFNGFVIHEALHLRHTDKGTLPELARLDSRHKSMIRDFGLEMVCAAINVIEDLYIEAQCPESLVPWLEAAWATILPAGSFTNIDWSFKNTVDAINAAVMYKNPELRNDPNFALMPADALAILEMVVSNDGAMPTTKKRVGLAFDYLLAFEDEKEDGEEGEGEAGEKESSKGDDSDGKGEGESKESSSDSFGDEEGDKGDDGEGESETTNSSIESSEKGTYLVPDDVAEDLDEAKDTVSEYKLDRAVAAGSSEESEKRNPVKEFKSDSYGEAIWREVREVDVYKAHQQKKHTWIDRTIRFDNPEHDFGFMKDLVAMRTINRAPGMARTSGTTMVKQRLTRIVTDGKIFAKQDAERMNRKRIEMIILIDFSSSMYGGRIINKVVTAAREISNVLRSANIAHSVYGHTSLRDAYPYLIHILSHDMAHTDPDHARRWEAVKTVNLEQNYDGVCIERVTKKFTGRRAARYLLVLSDGLPVANGYWGTKAEEHTSQVVKEARQAGIGVFSMSLVDSVVANNDRIYGKEFNLDATRKLDQQFRSLVEKLVESQR